MSVSDPGYIQNSKDQISHHKQSSSLGSYFTRASGRKNYPSTNTSALPIRIEIINNDLNSSRISRNISSNESFNSKFNQISDEEPPVLSPADFPVKIMISQPIECKPEPTSQILYSHEDSTENKDDERKNPNLFISFCEKCYNEQPLRCRHCSECNKCVAMFDHHCPFIGTCIGEKNRTMFFWYVFFQGLECWLGFFMNAFSVDKKNNIEDWARFNIKYVVFATICLILGMLIGVLWGFHLVLVIKNLTTWEIMKWDNIPYLSSYKFSPFSEGAWKNVKYYCRIHKKITQWKLPLN